MKENKVCYPLLWFTKITGLPLFAFFKYKIYYEGNDKSLRKPKRPCILMSNHTALFDFALYLALFYFRTLRFLMAEVLFNGRPLLGSFLTGLGGIKVDRDAYDFSFVGTALDILDRGGTVGVFPEGRLPRKGEKDIPFKSGIVYIALRTDAPIIPVCIDGNYGLFKRVHVLIGREINIHEWCSSENPSDAEIEELTARLKSRMDEMKAELERLKKSK